MDESSLFSKSSPALVILAFLITAILRVMRWYLIVLLICISLIIIEGVGNGNPCQYACLGNPMDREAWQARVHGVAKETDTTLDRHNLAAKNNNKQRC